MSETAAKKSDLSVRAASAVVMIAIAGTALWLGGWLWTAFVVAVALGVLWEWWGLVSKLASKMSTQALWMCVATVYVLTASATLWAARENRGITLVVLILGAVVATDVGAYFAGRTLGGPKIAPKISPSKTWSGLLGGMLASGLMLGSYFVFGLYHAGSPTYDDVPDWMAMLMGVIIGAVVAVIAQCGDFFESWMKRKAGVKDSGNIIPGHGGLFDRLDGILAVSFVIGLFSLPALLTPI